MSAATTPVPFFEGSEKRVEIRYLVDDDDAAGVRKIPVDVWSDALRKAGIAIENEMAGADYDCYMLSESSLFVGRTRIICKTCGQSAPLAILDDAIRCAKDFGCEAQHVIFSRSDLLRPSAQDPVHRSFDTERTFLDAVLPHAISSNAYQLGDSASAHWNLYIATLPTESQAAADRVAPTLEIAMYGLDPTTATSVWWADEAGSADVAREVSGLGTVVPGDAIVDEMLFEPCGYSMNAHDPRGALCTVHVTPQPSCSFASFEITIPSSERLVLIAVDSFSRALSEIPLLKASFRRSDPAKSTMWSFARFCVFVATSTSARFTVTIAWDREETAFMSVHPTTRILFPKSQSFRTSSKLCTTFSVRS